jgi:hypothetical protein
LLTKRDRHVHSVEFLYFMRHCLHDFCRSIKRWRTAPT